MSVKHDVSGRRTVDVNVEVAGTPEQVWQAIATGPGISSWFVPTQVDEREGGRIAFDLGPGMESVGSVTTWDPPRRFAYEEREWAPDAPPIATEFTIEARSGGTCLVRLVHSLFASGNQWDDQLESFESGWPAFFEVLRIGLRHFAGQPSATIRVTRSTTASESETWGSITRALGLGAAVEGQRPVAPEAGVPRFDGVVERVRPRDIVVRLEHPAPGVGLFGVYTWAERVSVSITLYLFGADATAAAARQEPAWRDWLERAAAPPQSQGLLS